MQSHYVEKVLSRFGFSGCDMGANTKASWYQMW
jgi:hypothetical protein